MFNFFLKYIKYTSSLCLLSIFFLALNINNASAQNNTSSQSKIITNNSVSNGHHLALACLSCHSSPNMPNLYSISQPVLQQKMQDYAKDVRKDTIMHQLLKGYSEQDIEAISNYFSSSNKNIHNGDK